MDTSKIFIKNDPPQTLEKLLSHLPITLELTDGTELSSDMEDGIIYIEPIKGFIADIKLGAGITVEAHDEYTLLISHDDQKYAIMNRPPRKPF